MEQQHSTSPKPNKFKNQRLAHKVMVIVFWDEKRVIMFDFLKRFTAVNGEQNIESLRELQMTIKTK